MIERIFHLIRLSAAVTFRGLTFSAVNARTNGEEEGEAVGFVFRPVRIIPAVEPAQPERTEEIGPEFFCPAAEPDIQTAAATIEAFCTTPPAPVYSQSDYDTAIQGWLDGLARALNYDGILSACSYAVDLTTPKFQSEGQAFLRLRSKVWARCYVLLANPPTPIPSPAELIAQFETEFATDIPRP